MIQENIMYPSNKMYVQPKTLIPQFWGKMAPRVGQYDPLGRHLTKT